jgi:hypothetical protein
MAQSFSGLFIFATCIGAYLSFCVMHSRHEPGWRVFRPEVRTEWRKLVASNSKKREEKRQQVAKINNPEKLCVITNLQSGILETTVL